MTRRLFGVLAVAACLAAVGCDYNPGQVSDPVDIRGKVTMGGQPVADVYLVLQPMEKGYQTNLKLGPDGSFTGQAVPGKYMYYFHPMDSKSPGEQSKLNAAYNRIPDAYRSPNLERSVSVSGGELTIHVN
jgi:hypothetical protein